jgi:hypothetical protein
VGVVAFLRGYVVAGYVEERQIQRSPQVR